MEVVTRSCAVIGCDKSYRSRGLCSMHYDRWLRSGRVTHGDLILPKAERNPLKSRLTDEEKQIVSSALTRFRLGRKRVVIFTNEGKGKKYSSPASNPVPPFNVASLFA